MVKKGGGIMNTKEDLVNKLKVGGSIISRLIWNKEIIITEKDIGKCLVVNSDKKTWRFVTWDELLKIDLKTISEWAEISKEYIYPR